MVSVRTNEYDDQVFWTITKGEQIGQKFCTNKNGEGIWSVNSNGVKGNQLTGTTQFSLLGVSRSTMHRRIRKFHGIEATTNG